MLTNLEILDRRYHLKTFYLMILSILIALSLWGCNSRGEQKTNEERNEKGSLHKSQHASAKSVKFDILTKTQGVVESLSFSGDGDLLAVDAGPGKSNSKYGSSAVQLWDMQKKKVLRIVEVPTWNVKVVALSPDGSMLATAVEGSEVYLWSTNTGKLLHILEKHKGNSGGYWEDQVGHLVFSPDSKLLVSSHAFESKIWNPQTGELIRVLPTRRQAPIAFSPDGSLFASSKSQNGIVQIRYWDTKTWKLKQSVRIKCGEGWNDNLVFAPNGKSVAVTGGEIESTKVKMRVCLMDVVTGHVIHKMEYSVRSPGFFPIAFSPNGKWLASTGDEKRIRLWNVQTGELREILQGSRSSIASLAFSSDGAIIVTGGSDRMVKLWHVK